MKRSTLIGIIIVAVVLVAIVGVLLLLNRNKPTAATGTPGAGTVIPVGQGPVDLANMPKPKLVAQTFHGCPSSGDGGDPVLNTLKDRIDQFTWYPTTVASIVALQWPHTIERQPRAHWSKFDTAEIARYEGDPVQVEGYFADARRQGPESCNCHSTQYEDYHIWMIESPSQDRTQSLVVEVTPRVQQFHPAWTGTTLSQIARQKQKVRISGWLMMDPEHPDQVGKTRGTIWEIHPILQIETLVGGKWQPLDTGDTSIKSVWSGPAPTPGAPLAAATAPPITPEATAPPPAPGSTGAQYNQAVQITALVADGKKAKEPDEYVEISNKGTQPVDLTAWSLQDPAGHDVFKWESGVIQPGQYIRVYTNEIHADTGGYSFGYSRPIWNNSGGVAELYDADKVLVSRYPYGNQK